MSELSEIVLSSIEAASIVVASVVATYGVSAWRRELVGKRKAQLAEETLAMFYEARELIAAVRHPGSFGGEGASRPRQPGEDESQASYRDSLYAPVERLMKRSEFWGRFDASKYRYSALFGLDASKPFDDIRAVRSRIMIACGMLIRTVGRESMEASRGSLRQQHERWEEDIGWGLSDSDDIRDKVEIAVAQIENVCRPAIFAAGKSWSPWGKLVEIVNRMVRRGTVFGRKPKAKQT